MPSHSVCIYKLLQVIALELKPSCPAVLMCVWLLSLGPMTKQTLPNAWEAAPGLC